MDKKTFIGWRIGSDETPAARNVMLSSPEGTNERLPSTLQ